MSGEILQLLVQRNKIDVKAYFSEGTIGKEKPCSVCPSPFSPSRYLLI